MDEPNGRRMTFEVCLRKLNAAYMNCGSPGWVEVLLTVSPHTHTWVRHLDFKKWDTAPKTLIYLNYMYKHYPKQFKAWLRLMQ
jgi:hypothetical protein